MRRPIIDNSFVFHRRLDRDLSTAVRAEGVWITDAQGKQYLDAGGGPICVNVGHGRREVVEAVAAQAPPFTIKEKELDLVVEIMESDLEKFGFGPYLGPVF